MMSITLNKTCLAAPLLSSDVVWPSYDRSAVTAGIAHIGVGNFHRAHQARYIDRCLAKAGQSSWGICGIGLGGGSASRVKARALQEQDCLYTLTEYADDGAPRTSVIGALLEYHLAPDNPGIVLERLSDPSIRIVSLTITEGGYNLDEETGAFRLDTPDVQNDLVNIDAPRTAFGFIVCSLMRRRRAGVAPFTVMSCDNQRDNGAVARRAVVGFAAALDPPFAQWIADEVSFPNSMVDRIVPTVTTAGAEAIRLRTGILDRSPVTGECFSQWVLQDRFPTGRPEWELEGVEMQADVTPFEAMKGRLLNASHMMLCFPGLRLAFLLACFGRYLKGIDDRGATFEPVEPNLFHSERARHGDAPAEALLDLSPFKALKLDQSQRFVEAFRQASVTAPISMPD
jgi:mannitol 2-dehydrogenase